MSFLPEGLVDSESKGIEEGGIGSGGSFHVGHYDHDCAARVHFGHETEGKFTVFASEETSEEIGKSGRYVRTALVEGSGGS